MQTITFTSDQLSAFKAKVDGAKKIALFGHEGIDGDALGSILGLGYIFEKLGKDISYFTTITPAAAYNFIPGIEKVKTDFDYGTYDLIFFLDFTPYNRIQAFTMGHEEYFDKQDKIVVDHHIDAKQRGNLELKDTMSSSNCGLCFEICRELRPELIDEKAATYRYLGVTTDTGNFMRGKSPARDFHIASALLEHGAQRDFIIQNIFFSNKPALLDMAKIILGRASTMGNIMYTRYTNDELDSFGLSDDEVESVQITLKSIRGLPVFLRLRFMGTYRSGSLRSGRTADGKRVSVQAIAVTFEKGGGHLYAAGFATAMDSSLSLEEDAKRIVAYVNEQAAKQLV